ncbi:MAG: DUF305 domain-containing protein [Chitinophagaceae bacterium]|nr:DUF305 domain-containing protein [Anaerolineae bacterium]
MRKLKLTLLLLSLIFSAIAISSIQADAPTEGREGRAELRFLEGMIDHHQMALDMGADCLVKVETEPVLTLCQNIIDAQTAEIVQMQGWLLDWYNVEYTPMAMSDMGGMSEMNHSMPGMAEMPYTDPAMMMGMFAGFNRLEGREYELAWLESMIDHHDDAIHMAERLLPRVEHDELRALAQNIIDAQTAEITVMEDLLTELAQ